MIQKLTTIGVALVLSVAVSAVAAEVKIGVVDFQSILAKSKAGQKVDAELKSERQRMEKDFEGKRTELEELKKKLEREAMVMSRETREEKEIELRVKLKGAQDLEKQYRQELMRKEQEEVKKIQTEVLKIVADIGKKGQYTLVTSKLGVLYSADSVDLTDEVIKALDARQ
jgi:outer membrane protein